MTLPSTDHSYLEDVTPDRLAALVLELASQLHVERQRRIALEAVLERKGILPAGALDGTANDAAVLEKGRAELDRAMRHLLRIVTETGDPRAPLRAEHRPGRTSAPSDAFVLPGAAYRAGSPG